MIFFKHIKIWFIFTTLLVSLYGLSSIQEEKLAWVQDNNAPNLCGGYYESPLLIGRKKDGIAVRSQHAEGVLSDQLKLSGKVSIYQSSRWLKASRAILYKAKKTKKIDKIALFGNVRLDKPAQLILGDEGTFWPTRAYLKNAWYRFARDDQAMVVGNRQRWYGLNSWGHAALLEQISNDYYRLHQASYATCPPQQRIWSLESQQLDIDKSAGLAYGYHSTLKIKSIPIFYWPYFSYPIDKRRRTGFLLPTYHVSRLSGNDISLPFYWNMAPNYDLTITPHYLSLRGLLTHVEGRYLGRQSSSTLQLAYMNRDNQFADLRKDLKQQDVSIHTLGDQRLGVNWHASYQWRPELKTTLDYHEVSDDYFYRDLSGQLLTGAPNHLLKSFETSYLSPLPEPDSIWQQSNLNVAFKQYRTLHPHDEQAVLDQYSMLPNILANNRWQWENWQMNLMTQATRFEWPHRAIVDRVDGNRIIIASDLSYHWDKSYGFLSPTLSSRLSHYSLNNANEFLEPALQSMPDHRSILVNYMTVDAGLFFDKALTSRYQQTLMPHLKYVYIPYKDQSTVPLFDTGLNQFSKSYLWEVNRFTGYDRIGDTNHLTYALTSEWRDLALAKTFLSMSMGQIYYFDNRRLAFCYGRDCRANRYLSDRTRTSPLIANTHFDWSDRLSADIDYAWYQSPRYASMSMHYQNDHKQQFNLNYTYAKQNLGVDAEGNYTLEKLKNFKSAFAWPLTKNWHLLGSWGYNLTDDHAHSYFAGAEYDSCCWAARVVAGQKLLYVDLDHKAHFDKMIYVQFLIKGLGALGTNPKTFITSALPNYNDQFSERFKL